MHKLEKTSLKLLRSAWSAVSDTGKADCDSVLVKAVAGADDRAQRRVTKENFILSALRHEQVLKKYVHFLPGTKKKMC